MRCRSVRIDPAAVDSDDVGMLEDLVLAAVNDALSKAGELNAKAFGSLGLGSLGDLGLPGLSDG
jgi:DNA-binding protein YbaB